MIKLFNSLAVTLTVYIQLLEPSMIFFTILAAPGLFTSPWFSVLFHTAPVAGLMRMCAVRKEDLTATALADSLTAASLGAMLRRFLSFPMLNTALATLISSLGRVFKNSLEKGYCSSGSSR